MVKFTTEERRDFQRNYEKAVCRLEKKLRKRLKKEVYELEFKDFKPSHRRRLY